jgi:copper homeostasis protein
LTSDISTILVEVCVGSMADVAAATAAGAERLELCAGLELGGLTPPAGLAEAVMEAASPPVVVIVRPRAGGFCYDRHEFAAMLRDAERFLNLGAAGIVFGILDRHGSIDKPRCRELVNLAGDRAAVFHRAFDFVADWRKELDGLVEIGCTRILTSGGEPTALQGAATLREMIDFAAGRIEIMPGGGIRADNVVEIVRRTHCRQVHTGAATFIDDRSLMASRGSRLGMAGQTGKAIHRAIDAWAVSAMVSALREKTLHA